jgi:hypothetical protein
MGNISNVSDVLLKAQQPYNQ